MSLDGKVNQIVGNRIDLVLTMSIVQLKILTMTIEQLKIHGQVKHSVFQLTFSLLK